MNTRARVLLTAAIMMVGACSTSTPIGVVDTAGASGSLTGASGSSGPVAGTTGSAGTAGAVAGTTGCAGTTASAGTGGSDGVPPGHYVPSAGQALNDPPFTNPAGISGDWLGYLQGYSLYFEGSDAVRLRFGVDAAGNQTIIVVRGNGPPPVLPRDAFDAWPEPAIYDDSGAPGPGIVYPNEPVNGFAYKAHSVTWTGSRLKFQLVSAEPWTTWCGLQTSYPLSGDEGTFSCNARDGALPCPYPASDKRCSKNHQWMCTPNQICSCNDTGCGASASFGEAWDITFLGDHATGIAGGYSLILMPASS